jgi:hypothetical protein
MEESIIKIDIPELQKEITAELRKTEIRAAELRGQLQLITRMINSVQPVITGDPLGDEITDPAAPT